MNFIHYLSADDEAREQGILSGLTKEQIYGDLNQIVFGNTDISIQI